MCSLQVLVIWKIQKTNEKRKKNKWKLRFSCSGLRFCSDVYLDLQRYFLYAQNKFIYNEGQWPKKQIWKKTNLKNSKC